MQQFDNSIWSFRTKFSCLLLCPGMQGFLPHGSSTVFYQYDAKHMACHKARRYHQVIVKPHAVHAVHSAMSVRRHLFYAGAPHQTTFECFPRRSSWCGMPSPKAMSTITRTSQSSPHLNHVSCFPWCFDRRLLVSQSVDYQSSALHSTVQLHPAIHIAATALLLSIINSVIHVVPIAASSLIRSAIN